MPNWGSDHCMKRSIQNEKKRLSWMERDDDHCNHDDGTTVLCCYCGETMASRSDHGEHLSPPRGRNIKGAV